MDELVDDSSIAPSDGQSPLLPWRNRSSSQDRRDEILRMKLMELARREAGPDMGEDAIGRLVDEAIASFASARVRTFVSILAWRRVRTRLRISAMPAMDPYVADPQSP